MTKINTVIMPAIKKLPVAGTVAIIVLIVASGAHGSLGSIPLRTMAAVKAATSSETRVGDSSGEFLISPGYSGGDPDSGNTSIVVNDTHVTLTSSIELQYDASIGQNHGANCSGIGYIPTAIVQSRVPGQSFQVVVDKAPINQPFCFTYTLVNQQ